MNVRNKLGKLWSLLAERLAEGDLHESEAALLGELFKPSPGLINRWVANELGCDDRYWVSSVDFASGSSGQVPLPNGEALDVEWTDLGEEIEFRAAATDSDYVPLVLWVPAENGASQTVLPAFETQWGADSSEVARSLAAAEDSDDDSDEHVNSGIYADCAFVSRTQALFDRSIRIWLYVKPNLETLSSAEFRLFNESGQLFDDTERRFDLNDVRPKPIQWAELNPRHKRVAESLKEGEQLPRVFRVDFPLPDDIEDVRTAQLVITRQSEAIPDGAQPIVLSCDEDGAYTATRSKKHFSLNQHGELRSGYLLTVGQRNERWQEIVNDPVIRERLNRDFEGHATNVVGDIPSHLEKGSKSKLLSKDAQIVRGEVALMEHREKRDARRQQRRQHTDEVPEGKLGPDFQLDVTSTGEHAGRTQNIRSALSDHIADAMEEFTLQDYEAFLLHAQEQINAVVKKEKDRDFFWLLLKHGLTVRETVEFLNDGRSYETLRNKAYRVLQKLKEMYQTRPDD